MIQMHQTSNNHPTTQVVISNMNRKPTLFTTSILASAALAVTSHAVPRPDAAKQPQFNQYAQPSQQHQEVQGAQAPQTSAQPVAKLRAFLGIYGNPISPLLRNQLGINGNAGLGLEHIARNSPADKAGLKKYDIILGIDGKAIHSQQDIKEHILTKKPGDRIEISYLRQSKADKVAIELDGAPVREEIAQQVYPNAPLPQRGVQNLPHGIPPQVLERLNDQHKQLLQQLLDKNRNFATPHGAAANMPRLRDVLDNNFMFEFNGKELDIDKLLGGNGIGQINATMKSSVRLMDSQGSLKLETDNDNKTLSIFDRDGNTLFTGPYNTDEDKKALPADLRERVDKSGINHKPQNQFHLRIGR